MIHTEGLQFLLDVAVRKTQAPPAAYCLRWCTDATIAKSAVLADLTELSGNGYAPIPIPSDAADWTSASYSNGRKVTSKTCTFTASGGAWSAAGSWYLATTSDDSGVLIASGSLNSGAGVTLADTQHYDVAVEICLVVTRGWTLEGLQYLLEVAFPQTQSVPASFYAGLATDVELAAGATLASIAGELSGSGYARPAVPASSAGWIGEGEGEGDYQLVSEEATFTASGGAWNLARIALLATTSDNTGRLLGWRPVNSGSGYAVADAESIDVETSLLLTG